VRERNSTEKKRETGGVEVSQATEGIGDSGDGKTDEKIISALTRLQLRHLNFDTMKGIRREEEKSSNIKKRKRDCPKCIKQIWRQQSITEGWTKTNYGRSRTLLGGEGGGT